MSKVATTIRIEAELRASLNKICVRTGDQTYHIEQALRGYGPIKKLANVAAKATADNAVLAVPKVWDKPKGFIKPTVNELAQYFQGIGSSTCNDDANSFFDHFESNGWKVGGKATMKCWKAACRNWIKNKKKFAPKDAEGSFVEKNTDKSWREDL
jgi:hypothetical protein